MTAAVMHCATGEFPLRRYPARRRELLQAWCGADLLLVEEAARRAVAPEQLLVANDDHGALCVALNACHLWTDSALSALATARNRSANGQPAVAVHWSIDPPPAVTTALVRVPKQLPFFEYQLARLAHTLAPGSQLLFAGMDKHLSPNTAALIDRYFPGVERHPGARKARLFSATARGGDVEAPPNARYFCPSLGRELEAGANVFSREALDIGSRFLLEHLGQQPPVARAADLACGNGVLGLHALAAGLCQHMLFCDESAMAIASARANAAGGTAGSADFHLGDGLRGVSGALDLVLCNPPFHLGHTVDEFAGRRLLRQAATALAPGGRLLLVANRHLDYLATLRRHFATVTVLANNRKFALYQADHLPPP